MTHDNTHKNQENIGTETPQQRYDTLIQQEIQKAIRSIKVKPEIAQSDKGQQLLKGLQNPTSDIYKAAVTAAEKNAIEELEQTEPLSQADTELLALLKNPPHETKNGRLKAEDIPPTVMLQTVEKIILGWTRIDVAKYLMGQDPLPDWLHPLKEMRKTDAVNTLSQRLRAADPKSDKFSHTKYQEHADAVSRTAQQALKERIYTLIEQRVRDFEQTDAEFVQLIEDAKKHSKQTEDTEQKRQWVKLWSNLNKQRAEREQCLTHFLQILDAKTTA